MIDLRDWHLDFRSSGKVCQPSRSCTFLLQLRLVLETAHKCLSLRVTSNYTGIIVAPVQAALFGRFFGDHFGVCQDTSMSAFDDDPEYEAQLKEVLGDEAFPSLQDNGDEEMGEFEGPTRQDDEQSEDGVLDNAPTFRMKVPGNSDNMDTANQLSVAGEENGPALSEDARSISTGDDSPSVQVPTEFAKLIATGIRDDSICTCDTQQDERI